MPNAPLPPSFSPFSTLWLGRLAHPPPSFNSLIHYCSYWYSMSMLYRVSTGGPNQAPDYGVTNKGSLSLSFSVSQESSGYPTRLALAQTTKITQSVSETQVWLAACSNGVSEQSRISAWSPSTSSQRAGGRKGLKVLLCQREAKINSLPRLYSSHAVSLLFCLSITQQRVKATALVGQSERRS